MHWRWRRCCKPAARVVVVGGGWIGLEVAATARKKGADVVVVEAQRRLCERTVPPEISEHLLALHRVTGTRVLLGACVAGVAAGDDGSAVVTLTNGEHPGLRRDRRRNRPGAERRTGACGRPRL